MIVYLTFGDQPSGIYRSQVEDLALFLRKSMSLKVKLVAFISIRGYFRNRKLIRSNVPDALVLPMLPRLSNWKMNGVILNTILRFMNADRIMARSVLATNLALDARNKKLVSEVVYDGRGAIAAEWNEYDVVPDSSLKEAIFELEKHAVISSDRQLAVTSKLVDYWVNQFGYEGKRFEVIPCTLNDVYLQMNLNEESIRSSRDEIGFSPEDVVLAYSGSTAGWQSIDELMLILSGFLNRQQNVKILFLGRENEVVKRMMEKYPNRIKRNFVRPDEVPQYLQACDYGLLIREDSTTNRVAAPVKFAEYLACGLKVIASNKIGDYSELIIKENAGFIFPEVPEELKGLDLHERNEKRATAHKHFTKSVMLERYERLLSD